MSAVQASSPRIASAPGTGGSDRLTVHRASLDALTGIRFFAALYVVIYHSKLPEMLASGGHLLASNFIANGYLAVLLFFLLSGFILSYTYNGHIERRRDIRRFWEARFARIWPLYAVSLLCSSLTLHNTPSLPRALAVIFMVQAWDPAAPALAGTWNFVCWTLSTEALFYLLFPLFQIRLERCTRRLQTAVMLLMMALSIALSSSRHVYGYPITGIYIHLPLAVLHVPEFVIGVCLGNLFLERHTARRGGKNLQAPWFQRLLPENGWWTWIGALVSAVLLVQPQGHAITFTAISFAALLFGLAAEPSALQSFLSSRVLLVGGKISYGMYLLQWPCKMLVNALCDHAHIGSAGIRFVLDIALLIAVSAAGFYLIEDPARKLIRGLFARAEHLY